MKRNNYNYRKDETIERRARSSLSVSNVDFCMNLPSPALSTLTLTPGRYRNVDQDMETLRLSRQDNPFIQQVIASRESLIDHLEESDDANLMAKELNEIDVDPVTLPEMHEHMIRSPPPIAWPKSPVFQFPTQEQEDEMFKLEFEKKDKWSDFKVNSEKPLKPPYHHHSDKFSSLLTQNTRSEDSIRLVNEDST